MQVLIYLIGYLIVVIIIIMLLLFDFYALNIETILIPDRKLIIIDHSLLIIL